jgi:hypothetical protein
MHANMQQLQQQQQQQQQLSDNLKDLLTTEISKTDKLKDLLTVRRSFQLSVLEISVVSRSFKLSVLEISVINTYINSCIYASVTYVEFNTYIPYICIHIRACIHVVKVHLAHLSCRSLPKIYDLSS